MRIFTYSMLLVACAFPTAQAEWIQSLGQSEECIAMGGACVAQSGDYGAFYHNPAASADFRKTVFGTNLRLVDTRSVQTRDSAGSHDVDATNTEGEIALAPTIAAYTPLSDRITAGIGFGAPFAITADWRNKSGIHRYNMKDQSLFVLELTPTIAIKVSEKLSLGVGLNIIAFKQLKIGSLFPDSFGAALPPELGGGGVIIPTTPFSPIIGSIEVETDRDVNLGIPPDKFAAVFDEFAVTLGAQYRVNERLRLGAVYRSKTSMEWDGGVTLDLSPVGIPVEKADYKMDFDMPGHLQLGFVYDAVPDKLQLSFDLQQTFWSDADGIGDPLKVKLKTPLLGFLNSLELSYEGSDTLGVHAGVSYRLSEKWTILAGYYYDEAIFDDGHVDVLTYDADRNIWSLGLKHDATSGGAGWSFVLGLQAALYEDRDIDIGESQNLGGFSLPNLIDEDTLGFTSNRDVFEFGGAIWAVGFSAQYNL